VVLVLKNREGGELSPKGPIVGKEKPGVTISWKEIRKGLRAHKPYHRNFGWVYNSSAICRAKREAQLCARLGVAGWVSQWRRAFGDRVTGAFTRKADTKSRSEFVGNLNALQGFLCG